MTMDRDVTTAHTPEYIFSDTCREAIFDIKAFLRSSPPQDYTRRNADRVIANTLRNNHDPSETLWNDRDQCRFGRTMGILLFIREELEQMQELLSGIRPLSRPDDRVEPQLALVGTALNAADYCLNYLHHNRMSPALKSFQSMRNALSSLQAASPPDMASGAFTRIQHATALAWDLLNYAGK
jgi:hypothetical protein